MQRAQVTSLCFCFLPWQCRMSLIYAWVASVRLFDRQVQKTVPLASYGKAIQYLLSFCWVCVWGGGESIEICTFQQSKTFVKSADKLYKATRRFLAWVPRKALQSVWAVLQQPLSILPAFSKQSYEWKFPSTQKDAEKLIREISFYLRPTEIEIRGSHSVWSNTLHSKTINTENLHDLSNCMWTIKCQFGHYGLDPMTILLSLLPKEKDFLQLRGKIIHQKKTVS